MSNDIQNWLSKNTAASKSARASLEAYFKELSEGRVTAERLKYIETELKKIDTQQRGMGKLGLAFKDQWTQAVDSFKNGYPQVLLLCWQFLKQKKLSQNLKR